MEAAALVRVEVTGLPAVRRPLSARRFLLPPVYPVLPGTVDPADAQADVYDDTSVIVSKASFGPCPS